MDFDIVFRGDLVAGKNIFDVKQALTERFKLSPANVEKMFSGRPVVVKKGLEKEAAEHFRTAFFQAGALVELREATAASQGPSDISERSPEARTETASQEDVLGAKATPADSGVEDHSGLSVSPPGTPVLSEEEREPEEPAQVDVSALTLAPEGSDVLDDKDKHVYESQDIDTSHLNIDKP